MAKPLLTALNNLRQAATDRAAAKRLHLNYLEAYAEQTKVPKISDAVVFLDFLRRARGPLAKEGLSLSQWERDCSHHEGFAKFRSQFLEGNTLDKCSSSDLTRIYQNLRRMNLHEDAQQLWPRVAKAMEGRLPRDDLVRVWATCPPEKVPEMDVAMSKEVQHFQKWQVLSVLSRTGALPVQSKTLGICARHAAKMVKENFDISPADMATILYRLHVAHQKDTQEDVSSAMRTIKKELVSRSTTFDVGSISKLLPCLDSNDTELWHLIRGELSEERLKTASLSELLEILQFFQQQSEGRKSVLNLARRDSGGPEATPRYLVTKALTFRLSKGQALPLALTTVTRHLELVAPFGKLCEALLNVAINLRQDLYPVALWLFFRRTGEVDLVKKHKYLQPKFHRISEILEEHGIQRDKMSMQEMLRSARAMRVNQVKMPKCVEQMATIFVQSFQNAQRHVGGGAVEADISLEAEDVVDAVDEPEAADETPEAGEAEELKMALEKEDAKLAQVVSMSDTARKSLLSKVEELVLLFWVELARLEMPNLEVSKVALGICQSNTLQMRTIVECLLEMAKVENFNSEIQMGSQQLREPIRKAMAEASDSELLGLVPLGPDVDTAAMVFDEVRQRLIEDKLQLQSTSEVECLLGCLANLQREDECFQELIGKAAKLVFEQPMENSSEANRQIFAMTSGFLAELPMEDAQQEVLRPLLRPMLQRLHKDMDSLASTPVPEDLVHFLFSLTALYGGRLPFDLMSYAWSLALKANLAKVLASERRVELWAFSLCARHLSTETVWTSLRLVPNAESLDNSIFTAEDQKTPTRFPLEKETSQEELKQSLRLALSAAVPGEFGEADYQVPGTPFVVDFALQRLQVALLVPRRWHATSGSLKGQGKMMEAILQAKGWRLLWVWPHAWQSVEVEELTAALSHAIETPGAAVVPKSEVVEGAPETLEPNVTSVSDVSESKPSSFDSAAG